MKRGDLAAEKNAGWIIEEGQWYDLGKGWRARAEGPHVPGMMDHNHLYFKGNQMAVINRNRSQSHGSDLSKIPARVLNGLQARGLIDEANVQVEAASLSRSELVPIDIIMEAVERIKKRDFFARLLRNSSR
ncbi:hypothetical protein [Mesorhizobium sp. B2-8-9]|uniref:hypothetical protein n=1 Tax=Mesorhizobium sp. B2-8-9 TaxID=2589899 RepID=UPI00112EBA98|nr:hypothetical protein [Mesorhizobium sp. B2-8-9]TPI80442.1 hypothetical protein FJ423_12165 [Mesorhizobium sp. B2-8-9]